MIDKPVQNLIAALRAELKEYGEMLALLDQQQDLVVTRASHDLFQSITLVQSQMGQMARARQLREQAQAALARTLGQAETSEFQSLLALLPADYRPLVQALVDENNSLLRRTQQRAHQNHVLLSRSLELMQRFVSSLLAPDGVQVYDGGGQSLHQAVRTPALLEAVG